MLHVYTLVGVHSLAGRRLECGMCGFYTRWMHRGSVAFAEISGVRGAGRGGGWRVDAHTDRQRHAPPAAAPRSTVASACSERRYQAAIG